MSWCFFPVFEVCQPYRWVVLQRNATKKRRSSASRHRKGVLAGHKKPTVSMSCITKRRQTGRWVTKSPVRHKLYRVLLTEHDLTTI